MALDLITLKSEPTYKIFGPFQGFLNEIGGNIVVLGTLDLIPETLVVIPEALGLVLVIFR